MEGNAGMSSGEERNTGQRRSGKRLWLRLAAIALAAVLFVAGIALGAAAYVAGALKPVETAEEAVLVEIPGGMSSSAIAELLERQGLIRDAFVFRMYLRYKGEGHRFQAGRYEIRPGTAPDDIIAMLNAGDTVPEETLRLTVPEGWTVEQIADSLAALGLDKARFLELAASPERFPDTKTADIPQDERLRYALEGYLFPETYDFPLDSGEQDIVARMLDELDRKLSSLPEGWEKRLDELGISFHQMMTIASLIEREVAVDSERALVAGVIYNRIRQNMPLQIDATVLYAMGEHKDVVLEKDLQVDNPYNTYRYPGLPPGPIASPGLKSIEAALYPESTNYLYYVTKKDGSNEHLFAETYEEHLKNIDKSKRTSAGKEG
jgi:UPF0755 protein